MRPLSLAAFVAALFVPAAALAGGRPLHPGSARIRYFAGTGGITGPDGVRAADPATFTPDLGKSDDRFILAATLRL